MEKFKLQKPVSQLINALKSNCFCVWTFFRQVVPNNNWKNPIISAKSFLWHHHFRTLLCWEKWWSNNSDPRNRSPANFSTLFWVVTDILTLSLPKMNLTKLQKTSKSNETWPALQVFPFEVSKKLQQGRRRRVSSPHPPHFQPLSLTHHSFLLASNGNTCVGG